MEFKKNSLIKLTTYSVSCLSILSSACVMEVTPDFSFEAASGLYDVGSPGTYLSVVGTASNQVVVNSSVLAPLFSRASATSIQVSSSATEVSVDMSTSAGVENTTLLKTDFSPLTGPDTAGNYSAVVTTCSSRGGCTTPRTTAFTTTIQSRATGVEEVSNGCSTETRELMQLSFFENGTMQADIYLQTEFINIAGRGPGIAAGADRRPDPVRDHSRIRPGLPNLCRQRGRKRDQPSLHHVDADGLPLQWGESLEQP